MKEHYLTKMVARVAGAVLIVSLGVVSARASYESLLLSHGPIAFWEFTETAPSSPLNIVSNLSTLGSIGNGYLVSTFVTKGNPGIIGTCANFPNPNVISDVGSCEAKIEVPWNAALNPHPPFSIEFWAEPTTLSSDGVAGYCPISNFDPNGHGGGNRSGWLFYCDNLGTWHFRLGTTAGYAGVVNATSGFAATNVWQHIVATWDGTNANLYANGLQIGTVAAAVANWTDNGQAPIRMGATELAGTGGDSPFESFYQNNGNRGYCGNLSQVAIYTNVLTPTTISAHYQAASTNNAGYVNQILAAHPVGYWPLTDPAVTPPDPSTYPVAHNSGSLGSIADGTNQWGALAGQAGPGYAGFANKTNAVFFDGDNGYLVINDTQAAITDNTGIHATNNPNTITLAAWVKPTEQDFYRDIIDNGFDFNFSETFLRISPGIGYGGGNYYEVGTSDGLNSFEDAVLAPIPPGDVGNWVYLVGTFDGTNWNLYRNGVLQGTAVSFYATANGLVSEPPPIGVGAVAALDPWTIGSRYPDPKLNDFYNPPQVVGQGEFFGGSIAEPAILTNALSADDVAALYMAAEVPPVITQGPTVTLPIFSGATVPFSVWADGVGPLGYLWFVNGVSTGVTATNYTINNIAPGNYTVSVVVTNAYGTNTPSVTFTVVNEPPFIIVAPTAQLRYAGFPFTLSVTAGGTTPLSYYWEQNGAIVQSGSSTTYSNTASVGTAGSYTVIISNVTGINATSAPVAVTVRQNPGGYAGLILSNGPIAFWRLDETNGSTAFDSVGGNNGTYFFGIDGGLTTLGVPGYSPGVDADNLAVSFNGSNSYVGNISGTAINFAGTNNNSFTLEAWANAPAGQADQASIIAKGIGNSGTTENEQFVLDVSGGVYRFFTAQQVRNGANVIQALATEGPDGTWKHVVGVYDSVKQSLTIYVNGANEGSTPYSGAINGTVSPVSIGSKRLGNDPNYNGTFDGSIDNVAVYNYALSDAQVAADYSIAFGTNVPPTILIQPPAAVTNYAGLAFTLSVAAYGSHPLGFQWYQGSSPLSDTPLGGGPDGSTITGSAGDTLTVSGLAYVNAGTYYCSITNNYYSTNAHAYVVGATNTVHVQVVILPPPSTPPVIPGLVMHLPFDNDLRDITGRGNDGKGMYSYIGSVPPEASNAVTVAMSPDTNSSPTNLSFYFPTDGALGSGLHVSTEGVQTAANAGFGTNNYYVTLGVRPDLQFGTNSFTVSYWVRTPQGYGYGVGPPTDFGGGGDLPFFTDSINSEGGPGFDFSTSYAYGTESPPAAGTTPANIGDWGLTIYNGGGSGVGIRYYGKTIVNDGFWHHLVHVVDQNANKVTTYLDGLVGAYSLIAGTDLNSAGNINNGNPATIGQDPTGLYGETGNFDLDDLGVWNRAITPLEAASIYIAAVSNQFSFTSPVELTIVRTNGNQVAVFWPMGVPESSSNVLQSSANLASGYTNVVGATSPYILPANAKAKYFRVQQMLP